MRGSSCAILRRLCIALGLILSAVFGTVAYAHSFNESYVYFDVTEDSLSGRIEITLNDLTRIQQQKAAVDEPLKRKAVRRGKQEFHDYFQNRLRLSFDGQPYQIEFNDLTFFKTKVGRFAQFHFDVLGIEKTPTTIEMSYDVLFSNVDPEHRGFALIGSNTRNGMEENEAYITLVFSPGVGSQSLYLNDEPTKDTARAFFERGIWHIWLGPDHLLFLLAVLLSAVMRNENGRWVPSDNAIASLGRAVRIVTVFATANAVAMLISALAGFRLPVPLTDALVALSVIAIAAGNLSPRFHTHLWKAVIALGLIHGVGHVGVLDTLGADATRQALGVLTFNIGVEIGLLAVVLALFPVFFLLRQLGSYQAIALKGGSVAVIACTVLWLLGSVIGPFAAFAGGVN